MAKVSVANKTLTRPRANKISTTYNSVSDVCLNSGTHSDLLDDGQ